MNFVRRIRSSAKNQKKNVLEFANRLSGDPLLNHNCKKLEIVEK